MNKLKIIDLRTNGIVFIKVLEEVELIILRQSPDLFFDSIWFEVNVQKEVIRENRSNYKMIVIDDYNNFISGWPKSCVISLEDYKKNIFKH